MALFGVNTHARELILSNVCKYSSSVFITVGVRDHVAAIYSNMFAFHNGKINFLGKSQ